jgi:hypothetical protein
MSIIIEYVLCYSTAFGLGMACGILVTMWSRKHG